MPDYSVQLGLFGLPGAVCDGTHRVRAHLRALHTGGTAFVAEHVRWNRGRTERREAPRPTKPARRDGQLGLFTNRSTSSAMTSSEPTSA